MSEHTYPLELLRAELKSAMAEQLVNLMDRFVSKADFNTHTKEDEQHFREINEKLDLLFNEKQQRDGAKTERTEKTQQRFSWQSLAVTLLSSVIAAAATLVAYAVWG